MARMDQHEEECKPMDPSTSLIVIEQSNGFLVRSQAIPSPGNHTTDITPPLGSTYLHFRSMATSGKEMKINIPYTQLGSLAHGSRLIERHPRTYAFDNAS